jgi:hypothetical protein
MFMKNAAAVWVRGVRFVSLGHTHTARGPDCIESELEESAAR